MDTYIWDLDGTLIDSYCVISKSAWETAKDVNINDSLEDVLKFVKRESVKEYFLEVSSKSNQSLDYLFERYRCHTKDKEDSIILIPHAKEILELLKDNGTRHFVYTHRGSSTISILKRLGIYDYFDEIVTSLYGFSPKPSGEGIKYLVNKYHLDLNHTYYVGDRSLDILASKDANVNAILYLPKDSPVLPTGKEDLIIDDLLLLNKNR